VENVTAPDIDGVAAWRWADFLARKRRLGFPR
jgi:hypothetical protein